MRIISLLVLVIAILFKTSILNHPLISNNLIRYFFAFSLGLFVYAYLKPHVDLIFSNKQELSTEFIEKHIPEFKNKNVYLYSADMPFKPNAFAIKKKKPSIFIDRSLIDKLSINELRFVLLHEYSHLKDNDSLKMHLASLSAFALVPFAFFIIIPIIKLPSDALPLTMVIILLVSIYFLGLMLNFKYKRNIELKCDSYASNYVDDSDIKSVFQKLIDLNIFNHKKRSTLSSYPSLNERLDNLDIQINHKTV